jgi:hypothetical protein
MEKCMNRDSCLYNVTGKQDEKVGSYGTENFCSSIMTNYFRTPDFQSEFLYSKSATNMAIQAKDFVLIS